jgi:hypothetical protein
VWIGDQQRGITMPTCHIEPADKKALSKTIGRDLVQNYGKKKYYSKAMVDSAMRRQSYSPDWSCWSYSLFTSSTEFAEIHRRLGETCDYESMRSQMVSAVTNGSSVSWFDVDLSWLDWPDLGFANMFDWTD